MLFSDYFVDYNQIHPLVIDKVIVKAKKLKNNYSQDGKIAVVKD